MHYNLSKFLLLCLLCLASIPAFAQAETDSLANGPEVRTMPLIAKAFAPLPTSFLVNLH